MLMNEIPGVYWLSVLDQYIKRFRSSISSRRAWIKRRSDCGKLMSGNDYDWMRRIVYSKQLHQTDPQAVALYFCKFTLNVLTCMDKKKLNEIGRSVRRSTRRVSKLRLDISLFHSHTFLNFNLGYCGSRLLIC